MLPTEIGEYLDLGSLTSAEKEKVRLLYPKLSII
jgi:hypothetical protein